MNFDYKTAKAKVLDILTSKTTIEEKESIPKSESEFTYENGIRTWVGALFIDIRNSTNYFKDNNSEKVARVMRAFCSEIIYILRQNENYRQIGIRGDCVYAIYSVPHKEDIKQVLSDAIFVNTFQRMFQKILEQNKFPLFEIGVGLGDNKDLVIKAGKEHSGINDYIWIGDAVVNAAKLAAQGNKDGFGPIVLDSCFYENIKGFDANNEFKYPHYMTKKKSPILKEEVYCCDMINIEYNDWIDKEFK